MKTKAGKKEQKPKQINELINDAEMLVFVSLDKDGIHYRSSTHEEGLALIALLMSSNEESWGIIQEYVNMFKFTKQRTMN